MSSMGFSTIVKRVSLLGVVCFAGPLVASPAHAGDVQSTESVKGSVQNSSSADTVFVQDPVRETRQRPNLNSPYRRTNHRTSSVVLAAFREAIGENWKATATIYQDNSPVALGTIVDRRGWLITKNSELYDNFDISVHLFDGRQVVGKVVARSPLTDLALIRLPVEDLPAISWKQSKSPNMGAWLISTDITSTPLGIGVVSAADRRIAGEKPVLGVSLSQAANGALISMVLPGSGAEEAGLKVDDIIEKIGGEKLSSRRAVLDAIANYDAGSWMSIQVRRENSELEFVARLKDISVAMMDPTEQEVNGEISARSTSFEKVMQHDSVLNPNQCGGPVFDSSGFFVGVNIARAGRVSSYALPTDVVRTAIEQMYASIKQSEPESVKTVVAQTVQP